MKYKITNFSEIDKYAIQSYCLIHNENTNKNLGDVSKVDITKTKDFNCLFGGSPCQDYSIAGKKNGAMWECKECRHKYNPLEQHYSKRDKCPCCESKNIKITRSSLIIYYLNFLREKKPKFAIYENVKNLQNKEFKPQFDMFLKEVEEYGYNVYWKVLNAKEFGVPQNRERIYVVIIRKDVDNCKFEFPIGNDSGIRIKDIEELNVDTKYFLSLDKSEVLIKQLINENKIEDIDNYNKNQLFKVGDLNMKSTESIKRVYAETGIAPTFDTMQGGHRQPKILSWKDLPCALAVRGRYIDKYKKETKQHAEINKSGILNTLTTVQKDNYICDIKEDSIRAYYVRKLTPLECFRGMGFSDCDFIKARYGLNIEEINNNSELSKNKIILSDTQAYKQIGNSIAVPVLTSIFKSLYLVMPSLFEDLKICSLFSGIGAFEKAIKNFYDK